MKKIFKVVLFIFVVGSIILFNSKSYASTLNEKEKTFFNDSEIAMELEGANKSDILKKANSLLLLLNIKNTNYEEKVYKITDKNNHSGVSEYYKVLYNGDSYISFSKDGELIEADTFFYKVPKSDIRNSSLYSQSSIDILSHKIKNKGYVLKEKDDNYFNGNTLYRFEKAILGDLTNRFDNYTIVYDTQNENIVSFMKISNPVEYKEPMISLEEARKTAINYSQTNNIRNSVLGVYKDDNGNVNLGYIVDFENGITVVVSPYENKIVHKDIGKEKLDINILNEFDQTNKFIFGDFFGAKYILNDKAVQKKVGEKIDSLKESYYNSKNRIKTYSFIIETDNYQIGILNKPYVDGYYLFSISSLKNMHSFNTYRTKTNVYAEVMNILNSSENVDVQVFDTLCPVFPENSSVVNSIKTSQYTHARSENAILVGKDSVPDSLCSASLAGYLNAPILLSSKDNIDAEVLSELDRLHVKNVYITSGENVISSKARDELKSKGYKLFDYSGIDRYDTSNKITKLINKDNKFILASGENFNDIPSISPYACENKIPVVLTEKNRIPNSNFELFNKASNILSIGGYKTIDSKVYNQLKQKEIKVKNIAGVNRYDTSKKIVEYLYPNSKQFIYKADSRIIDGIVLSNLSVKYKKPIMILKDLSKIRQSENNKGNIFVY
ncbi:MAG: cell wall-binding repeat-containing protein [Peptostreptococcus porci]|uniref:cell wall-binding repeat-containing protein n=1 Tax=Peptostreptococcus porci TaxID=2652282 RepID=UPI002A76204D|nr:cell wall-binding repeat-containing protein [Peptostreptococcus porci]MDY2794853.1 cell wall-binding repeat-containing protein [Peptostreptococcus porci]MDY5480160.1 cell wall-binding repeat-containing protein [Peptostreptococcus porci]